MISANITTTEGKAQLWSVTPTIPSQWASKWMNLWMWTVQLSVYYMMNPSSTRASVSVTSNLLSISRSAFFFFFFLELGNWMFRKTTLCLKQFKWLCWWVLCYFKYWWDDEMESRGGVDTCVLQVYQTPKLHTWRFMILWYRIFWKAITMRVMYCEDQQVNRRNTFSRTVRLCVFDWTTSYLMIIKFFLSQKK